MVSLAEFWREGQMVNSIRRRDVITLAAGAAALPFGAMAQQRRTPVIGMISPVSESFDRPYVAAFRKIQDAGG